MNKVFFNALSVFPDELKFPLEKAGKYYSQIYEIRLIAGISAYFFTKNGIRFIKKNGETEILPCGELLIPTFSQLEEITDRATGFSGFLHEKELSQGFITYAGGCRMGICKGGDGYSKGRITSVAVRIPVAPNLEVTYDNRIIFDGIEGGLLVSGMPASGKTTLLRYIAKNLSDGICGEYKKVTVIDERGELSAGYYLGMCTDVISGKKKSEGVLQALRLLSPHYIICDEIGSVDETAALLEGLNGGVAFIASMHAGNIGELILRKQFRVLYEENVFSKVLFLSGNEPGKIVSVFDSEEIMFEMGRTYGTLSVT